MSDLDYPVAAPDDIAPVIYRAMIIQAMAMEYMKAMRSSPEPFEMSNAFEAAQATWETEWDDDPAPRTIEAGLQEAQNDLDYWYED